MIDSGFIIRNMKMYFRQKSNIFYALMAVIIVVALYAAFLYDMYVKPEYASVMDPWLIAGIVSLATLTEPLSAYGLYVDDVVKGRFRDFFVSPIQRAKIMLGYILTAVIIGMLVCIAIFACGLGFMAMKGYVLPDAIACLGCIGVIFLSTLASCGLMFFIICFVKTTGAFSGVSTIVGTASGFLMGLYVPIGNFAPSVQAVIGGFPLTHGAAVLRDLMTAPGLAEMIPDTVAREEFQIEMGIRFGEVGNLMSEWTSIAILVVCFAAFFLLGYAVLRRRRA